MSTPDKLYYARNEFYIGNYHKCIDTCKQLHVTSEAENLEKLYYTFRSMICLGQYDEVMDQINNSPTKTVEMSAIGTLASYFAFPDKRSEAVQAIALLLNEEFGNTSLVRIIACTIYNNENDFDHAYLAVKNGETIEELSVLVYTLVRMNRSDLAKDVYKKMQKIDDDHVLSQLASTWIDQSGDDQLREHVTTVYEDLLHGNQSTMLLNNHGVAVLRSRPIQGSNAETFYSTLVEEHNNNPQNETVLHNLIVVSNLIHRPDEEVENLLKELEALNPSNMLVTTIKNMGLRVEQLEKEFM